MNYLRSAAAFGTVLVIGAVVAAVGCSNGEVNCVRAANCVRTCGGPVVSSGCSCPEGTFDDAVCEPPPGPVVTDAASDAAPSKDAAVLDATADASDAAATDAAATDASDTGVPSRGFRYLYTVKPAARGDIASIAMADAACFAARPSGVTAVKALLVGTTRTACTSANCATGGATEHLDWPLAPSTEYRRADGTTIIARTNAIGLFDALTSSIGLVDDFVWTGLSPNGMGTGTNWTTSSSTCMNWASANAAQTGAAAYAGPTFKNVPFGHFVDTCDKNFVFYCAESN